MITILYWYAYYEPGMWDPKDLSTYWYPIYMHVLPLVTLAVDWMFNSIVFDHKRTSWISLYLLIAYLPLTYFAKWIAGYFPYSFVNYEDATTAVWIGITIALNMLAYYGVAYGTNHLKTSSGLSPSNFVKRIPNEFANLMKTAGI